MLYGAAMNKKIGRWAVMVPALAVLMTGTQCCSPDTAGRKVEAEKSLKAAFADSFLIGTALSEDQLQEKGAAEQALIRREFNAYTPENVMKWEAIHPEPDRYNFKPGDRLVRLARKNGAQVYGHTLVWHSQTPAWVFEDQAGNEIGREALIARMKDHIFQVVGHFKGQVTGWDVVNEALNEDGSLRPSPWYQIIGPEYLELAFRFAHEADPAAELYYNDYNIEQPAKRAGAIALVKSLQEKGIRVDAVGIQGHWHLDGPSEAVVEDSIKEFAALGVKVNITELDVSVLPNPQWGANLDQAERQRLDPYTSGLPEEMKASLATRYARLFGVFLAQAAVMDRITFWGVHDGQSWLNYWPIRGRTNHPLLFDRNYRPKQAWEAVMALAPAKAP